MTKSNIDLADPTTLSVAEYRAIGRANQWCYHIRHSLLWEPETVGFETDEEKNRCVVRVDTKQIYGVDKSDVVYRHRVVIDMYTNEVMSSVDIDFEALSWWSRVWYNIKEAYVEWTRPVRDEDYEPIYDLHGNKLSR